MTRKAKVPKEVAAAHAIVAAHRDAEEEQRVEKLRKYIGRFFKYRNTYGGSDKGWWMYGVVEDVQPYSGCTGWRFQKTSSGMIEIGGDQWVNPESGGWTEISAADFWRAAAKLRAEVNSRLTPAV